jgi:hypothetical protein
LRKLTSTKWLILTALPSWMNFRRWVAIIL